METFLPQIGGKDGNVESWLYSLRASYYIEDPIGAMRLKKFLAEKQPDNINDPNVLSRVGVSKLSDENLAIEAAEKAQKIWRTKSLKERKKVLLGAFDFISENENEVIEILTNEGHPYQLAKWETDGIKDICHPKSSDQYEAMMNNSFSVGSRKISILRKPDGVVCISPPRNAAFSNAMAVVQVLFAGNAVVLRAPQSTPHSVAWLMHKFIKPFLKSIDAPEGLVNFTTGAPKQTLENWLDNPKVNNIMYFGNSKRGIDFGNRAHQKGKKTVLELAGNDTVMVWKDADLNLAAKSAAQCFYGSAQICIVPKNVLVHPDVSEKFIELLVAEAKQIKPGLPEDKDSLLSPVFQNAYFFKFLDSAIAKGAELVYGGMRLNHFGEIDSHGTFLQPTIIKVDTIEKAKQIKAVTEETFFPLLPVVVCQDGEKDEFILDSMLDFINNNKYGLRNSLWSNNEFVIDKFVNEVNSGGLLKINDSHIGFVPGLSAHGGTGLSGGVYGESNFIFLKTSHLQGISDASQVLPRSDIFESATNLLKKDLVIDLETDLAFAPSHSNLSEYPTK